MKRLPQVLLVDDNPADVGLAREALAGGRHQSRINHVTDGEEAMAYLRRAGQYGNAARPDLLILDLGLPAGDGFAVLKNLQEYPALSVIPVIVLTARDPETNEKRTLESGAVAFFQKPADNEELLGVIRACLQTGWGWTRGLPS